MSHQQHKEETMRILLDFSFESSQNYSKNASQIIDRLAVYKNKTRIKEAIVVCQQNLIDLSKPIGIKNFTVKFLKDLFDQGLVYALQLIQQSILPIFKEIILYRSQIKSIKRGNTFVLSQLKNTIYGEDVISLVSRFLKPSQNYFQLVHECVLYWSECVEQQKSQFRLAYQSVKHCTFPKKNRHFKLNDVAKFREKHQLQMNGIQHQLQDCIHKWQQVKNKLKLMGINDFSRQNMEDFYRWIAEFVAQYTNLQNDLQNSYYYNRKQLQQRLANLLAEKKQFLKLYVQCITKKSFRKLHSRYGLAETIYQEVESDKSKMIKKRKVNTNANPKINAKSKPDFQDERITDMKRIYLADYNQYVQKINVVPMIMERNKYYSQSKNDPSNSNSLVKLPKITQNYIHHYKNLQGKLKTISSSRNSQSPSHNLKKSIILNGKHTLGSPQILKVKAVSKLQNSQHQTIINSPYELFVKKSQQTSGFSQNNKGHHSLLLNQKRKANPSPSFVAARSRILEEKTRSIEKNPKRSEN